MEIRVRLKSVGAVYPCLPGFVNINQDGKLLVNEAGREVVREMKYYEVYIAPDENWEDLIYAYREGFLEPEQLRKWP